MNILIHNGEYRTDRPHYIIIFWNDQFARFEFQSIFKCLNHTYIRCNPTLEDDRFQKFLSLPDVALEIPGHSITYPLQYHTQAYLPAAGESYPSWQIHCSDRQCAVGFWILTQALQILFLWQHQVS